MPVDVFLAACDAPDEPDPDRAPLDAALAAAGIRAAWPAWSDPDIDWSEPAVCFPRATWDYHFDLLGFLRWAEHVDSVTRLRNRLEVIRWNTHKSYMVSLEEAGVATVPTEVVSCGASTSIDDVRALRGWDNVVIKPAVSCASWEAHLVGEGESGTRVWSRLVGERDMLVQPFMPSVRTLGSVPLLSSTAR